MELEGTIHNGMVIPEGACTLPEGTRVRISVTQQSVPSIWEQMRRFAEDCEKRPSNLPADFAINHDHYIHGTPKRV